MERKGGVYSRAFFSFKLVFLLSNMLNATTFSQTTGKLKAHLFAKSLVTLRMLIEMRQKS